MPGNHFDEPGAALLEDEPIRLRGLAKTPTAAPPAGRRAALIWQRVLSLRSTKSWDRGDAKDLLGLRSERLGQDEGHQCFGRCDGARMPVEVRAGDRRRRAKVGRLRSEARLGKQATGVLPTDRTIASGGLLPDESLSPTTLSESNRRRRQQLHGPTPQPVSRGGCATGIQR